MGATVGTTKEGAIADLAIALVSNSLIGPVYTQPCSFVHIAAWYPNVIVEVSCSIK